MKKMYEKPEADKISFNYRDQVVAASGGTGYGGSFMQNIEGIGSPVCGTGGMIDRLLDYAGLGLCN